MNVFIVKARRVLSLLVVWEHGSSPLSIIIADGKKGSGGANDILRLSSLPPIVAEGKEGDMAKAMARAAVIQQKKVTTEMAPSKRGVPFSPIVAEGGKTMNLAAMAPATIIHWRSKG